MKVQAGDWMDATTRRYCPGCKVDRMLRMLVDSDGRRYWICRICWEHIPGDPADGWARHINSGRRRPGGDPSKEHVSR